MSQSTRSAESLSLLVRDAQGEYRIATGEEVLNAARQVLGRRGGARLYSWFVNQVLAALANLEISVIQSQFRHSQFGLVTNRQVS